jgi:hypothetical protein
MLKNVGSEAILLGRVVPCRDVTDGWMATAMFIHIYSTYTVHLPGSDTALALLGSQHFFHVFAPRRPLHICIFLVFLSTKTKQMFISTNISF